MSAHNEILSCTLPTRETIFEVLDMIHARVAGTVIVACGVYTLYPLFSGVGLDSLCFRRSKFIIKLKASGEGLSLAKK
jgi:hypothetical protein